MKLKLKTLEQIADERERMRNYFFRSGGWPDFPRSSNPWIKNFIFFRIHPIVNKIFPYLCCFFFFLTLISTVMLNVEISMSISFFYSTIECNCRKLRECLVCVFKQPFLIFKQYFTHFNTLFHPHEFSQIFLNNNFQFLNICTKRTLSV